MIIVPLTLAYKGQRNYLQGGDLYNGIIDAIDGHVDGKKGPFRLAVHNFASRQCDMLINESGEQLTKPEGLVAEFTIGSARGMVTGWLMETERDVVNRNPYDESVIQALCTDEGESIEMRGETPYTPIEVAISMTKQLHYRLYPIVDGKWIFTKLELGRLLEDNDSARLKVTARHNLNNRLTKSIITAGGEQVGSIYFSVKS
ncbi:MAG: hypothetical protein HY954_10935 [Deltaproteobacteria bacterium]|nr:hypothetical protein [Deltaproteobacteria bacterium]